MQRFIIIVATDVASGFLHSALVNVMEGFGDIILEWSVDLDDVDKVLRVVSKKDISFLLIYQIKKASIQCKLMDVFEDTDGSLVLLR